MSYLKYTPYIYLLFGFYFIYDGIVKYNATDSNFWMSFFIAGLAIFMFFFRRKFAKKIEDRNNKK